MALKICRYGPQGWVSWAAVYTLFGGGISVDQGVPSAVGFLHRYSLFDRMGLRLTLIY